MEILTYDFVQKSLISGILTGLCASLIGVFLILKRLSMIGFGLSHTAFGGIALSYVLKVDPLLFTLLFTVLMGLLVQYLSSNKKIGGESSIAVVFSFGTGLAVLILGITEGFGEQVFGFLFGSILMVSDRDLLFISLIFILILLFLKLFYKKLVISIFSEDIARLRGVRTSFLNYMLVFLASLTVVISVKATGIILASSIIVLPALTGLILSKSLKSSLIISSLVSLISVISGIILSLLLDLPPSGLIVLIMVGILVISKSLQVLLSFAHR